jgi:hypothetical protein
MMLVAIGLGLSAQFGLAMAAPAMQDNALSVKMSMSMPAAGHCSDCGMSGHASAATSTCATTPCLAAPAILASGLVWAPRLAASFPLSLYTTGNSLVIRPNLAPPKLLYHS